MSTRSNIVIQAPDGKVMSIYCHYDGYPEHNGKMLLEHYDTTDKVSKLFEIGSIRSLKPTPKEIWKERDRWNDEAEKFMSLRAYMSGVDTLFIEYIYMWSVEDERWAVSESMCTKPNDSFQEAVYYHTMFKPLVINDKEEVA